jgi:hypothetical protein
LAAHYRRNNLFTFLGYCREQEDPSAMPWYQALPILGSAAALSIMILIRPYSASRPMAFTLLVGALMLTSLGFAVKDFIAAVYVAAWLASS